MGKGDYLGEFEHIVLLALLRLRDNAYGVTIRQEIRKRTKREASIGSVYSTLSRMEQKGFVKSRVGEATEERGGRAKKYFVITAKGQEALTQTQTALSSMSFGLDPVLEGSNVLKI